MKTVWNILYPLLCILLCGFNGTYPFSLGVENLSPELIKRLRSKRIGLVCNQTSIDQRGKRTVDILLQQGVPIQCLLAPEHGFEGKIGAEKKVANTYDTITKLPVYSLYSARKGGGNLVSQPVVEKIDLLMFDIQDSGMRHFTYVSHLFHVLESAKKYNKAVCILDRPNPLGLVMEGPLVEKELASFISIAPIPVRHAMTFGELAQYFKVHSFGNDLRLEVVPMKHYNRRARVGLLTFLSPGIKTEQACCNYSYLGLLSEVRPIGTGFGDHARFECFMLPEGSTSSGALSQIDHLFALQGVNTVPHHYLSPRLKRPYRGFKLHVTDTNKLHAFQLLLQLLTLLKKQGVTLQFSTAFDRAMGTSLVKAYIEGAISFAVLKKEVNKQLQTFYVRARDSFLYFPVPVPAFLK